MRETIQVTFLPSGHESEVPAGTTILTAAHWVGLPIDSICGGRGTCGRCRVRIAQGTREITTEDHRLLDSKSLDAGWRLACRQAAVSDVTCVVPGLATQPKTATVGEGRPVTVEPDVYKLALELEPPSAVDTRSDLERLQRAAGELGHRFAAEVAVLESLPTLLRENEFRISAVLVGESLVAVEAGDTAGEMFGVAFDLGTTTVVGSLVDLRSGAVASVASSVNGQAAYGADVITRIAHAMQGKEQRKQLQRAALSTLHALLRELSAASGVAPERIYDVVVVGNSTMIHLLLGVEARSLAVAPFVPVFHSAQTVSARQLGLAMHPFGRIETFPLIGAYVGADTVAGVHATGMALDDKLRLFIDVGTNSEIALGSRHRIVATSAPAGPAFEGSCIRTGMAATTGAIERVALGEQVEVRTIDDKAAIGICGSGLIDAIAQLRRSGLLDASGRLAGADEVPRHPLVGHLVSDDGHRAFALTESIHLTQRDIRELQSAKSSVATGIRVLMERLGVGPDDLDEVLLAGSFGSAIDPQSARDVGLVPRVPAEKIRFVGNAAAEGAKMALLSFRERRAANHLAAWIEYVELSARPDFNELFVEELQLPELEVAQERL